MKKFLLGAVTGLCFGGLACLIILFSLARMRGGQPSVPSAATLVLRLEGEIPEVPQVDIPLPWLGSPAQLTLTDLWSLLRRAERDPRIKAIVVEPRHLGSGWAKLDELRQGLLRFRKSGKPVAAYLEFPSTREYYLATAADRIYVSPEDLIDVKGLRARMTFYKGALDKLGIQFEEEHAGRYKDGPDSLTQTTMSPATREVTNSILDTLYPHLVDAIAASRKLPAEKVRAALDDGPFLAPQAKQAGLIDELLYQDQVAAEIRSQFKTGETERISHRDYARVDETPSRAVRLAMVVGEGPISRGGGIDPLGEEDGIRSNAFRKLLLDVAGDSSIRGVILRINSPGGDSIASDEILHDVRQLSRKKPMVVSMSDLAASGGYYMAMSGDPVLAYSNTFTGSIGVYFLKPNLQGLYEKLGLKSEVITRGRNADIDSESRPMDQRTRAKLREGIDQVYRSFLDRVAEGRKRKRADIAPLAEGRVWMGVQAKSNGLIDEIGGLDRAVELLRQKAKLGKDEPVTLVLYPPKRGLVEFLFGQHESSSESEATARAVRAFLRRNGLAGLETLTRSPGGIVKALPYDIQVR